VPELCPLDAGHAAALLAFERTNRRYFAASIADRGDAYFDEFTDRLDALLAEQEAGISAFYLLVEEDGSIVGRFNLYDLQDGTAEVGYRVAQRVAGRGVASAALEQLCRLAVRIHGLHTLEAATSHRNAASQQVLAKAGFVRVGTAPPVGPGDDPDPLYRCDLAEHYRRRS
jgi:ribosomal-protein-alanine N-acetyltransferase